MGRHKKKRSYIKSSKHSKNLESSTEDHTGMLNNPFKAADAISTILKGFKPEQRDQILKWVKENFGEKDIVFPSIVTLHLSGGTVSAEKVEVVDSDTKDLRSYPEIKETFKPQVNHISVEKASTSLEKSVESAMNSAEKTKLNLRLRKVFCKKCHCVLQRMSGQKNYCDSCRSEMAKERWANAKKKGPVVRDIIEEDEEKESMEVAKDGITFVNSKHLKKPSWKEELDSVKSLGERISEEEDAAEEGDPC